MPARIASAAWSRSMLAMDDEGFRKSEKNGVEITTPAGFNALMNFYLGPRPASTALWSSGVRRRAGRQLVFQLGQRRGDKLGSAPVLASTSANASALAPPSKQAGARRRRRDRERRPHRPRAGQADGRWRWHDLTGTLRGCQAFEIMAGAEPAANDSSHFAAAGIPRSTPTTRPASAGPLIGMRKRIRQQSMWYGRRCDQLELRWSGSSGRDAGYTLQVHLQVRLRWAMPIHRRALAELRAGCGWTTCPGHVVMEPHGRPKGCTAAPQYGGCPEPPIPIRSSSKRLRSAWLPGLRSACREEGLLARGWLPGRRRQPGTRPQPPRPGHHAARAGVLRVDGPRVPRRFPRRRPPDRARRPDRLRGPVAAAAVDDLPVSRHDGRGLPSPVDRRRPGPGRRDARRNVGRSDIDQPHRRAARGHPSPPTHEACRPATRWPRRAASRRPAPPIGASATSARISTTR